MSMRAGAVCLAIALGACTASAPETSAPAPAPVPALAQVFDENEEELMAVAVIEPTEAMLKAALADDPEAMRDAVVALAGCQAASTCPAEYGSCSSWSGWSQCDQTCVGLCLCKPIWSPECEGVPPEPKGTNSYNSFRVCFNSSGQSCTEWQKTTSTFCGCE
jgi:hypothetical protein